MHDRSNFHVHGRDFIKDPILATHGVLADVSHFLPSHGRPIEILRVALSGRGPTDSKLSLTIREQDDEHRVHMIECPVRAEAYEVVRRFFENKAKSAAAPDLRNEHLPAVPSPQALLACAERAVAAIQARPEAQRSREPLGYALGDAIGLAVMSNDAAKATSLSRQLKRLLHIEPATIVRPAVTRTLLNSLAPVMRAAVASDRMQFLNEVLQEVVPATAEFDGSINESADMSRFMVALREFLAHGDADDIAAIFTLFNEPNLKLLILNMAVDSVTEGGSAQGINTCGKVVRSMLKECEKASSYHGELGWRIRAFSAAVAGNADKAEGLVDDVFRWSRGDRVLGWVMGVSTGLKIRSKHDVPVKEFLPHLKSVLYCGNEDYFEEVAPAFVRGLLTANQGNRAEVSEEILQALADQYPELDHGGDFTAGRFAHQLVAACRSEDSGRVTQCLEDLRQAVQILGDNGDALMLAMCEEIATDATLRNAGLRERVAGLIVDELSEPHNSDRYGLTRLRAGDLLFLAGYEDAALRVPLAPGLGEAGRLLWRLRAAAQESEAGSSPPEALVSKLAAAIDSIAERQLDGEHLVSPMRGRAWSQLIEEAAAINCPSLAQKAFNHALAISRGWAAREVTHLTDALLSGIVRRGYPSESD